MAATHTTTSMHVEFLDGSTYDFPVTSTDTVCVRVRACVCMCACVGVGVGVGVSASYSISSCVLPFEEMAVH